MFWDDDKKMLITASLDKSVKMHQFPIFWPSEMIRKSSQKNKVHLIPEEEKQKVIQWLEEHGGYDKYIFNGFGG